MTQVQRRNFSDRQASNAQRNRGAGRRAYLGAPVFSLASVLLWAVTEVVHAGRGPLPMTPIAALVFACVQLLLPRARWDPTHMIGPANAALLLFGLQLTVIPTLINVFGVYGDVLSVLPSKDAMNLALLLQAIGYVAFAIGVSLRQRTRVVSLLPRGVAATRLGLTFVVLGTVGLALRFGSPSALVAHFTGRSDLESVQDRSLAGAAGTFLRPFFSFGFAILLCDRWRRPGPRRAGAWVLDATMVVASLGAAATFDYNRSVVIIPIVALLTTFGRHVRRIAPIHLALVGFVLLVGAFQFGQYREVYVGTQGGRITKDQALLDGKRSSIIDHVQIYANGPQMWALVVNDTQHGEGFQYGSTILGSVLLPAPVIGAPFRAASGPTRYNELVYGDSEVADQVLGYGAEMYWNFGEFGVLAGGVLLGLSVRFLDARSRCTNDPLVTYTYTYIGLWVALLAINSLSITSQAMIYFMPPAFITIFFFGRRVQPPVVRRPSRPRHVDHRLDERCD